MKDIDLDRTEYRVIRPDKCEPFFGPGWPFGAAALVTIFIGTVFHDASAPIYILGAIGGAILGAIFQQFYR